MLMLMVRVLSWQELADELFRNPVFHLIMGSGSVGGLADPSFSYTDDTLHRVKQRLSDQSVQFQTHVGNVFSVPLELSQSSGQKYDIISLSNVVRAHATPSLNCLFSTFCCLTLFNVVCFSRSSSFSFVAIVQVNKKARPRVPTHFDHFLMCVSLTARVCVRADSVMLAVYVDGCRRI